MNKLTVYTSTGQPIQELEIGGKVSAPLIYKLADIRTPDTKGGSYSKTIKLKGTKENNLFFGGIYDVNVQYLTFNPNLKTWIRWTSEDEEILSGYMKLIKVSVDDMDDVWYDVVIFDTTVDFWSNIEGKYVFELPNLQDLAHVWNGSNIKASWTTDWDQMGVFYPVTKNSVTVGVVSAGQTSPRTYTDRLYPAAFHKRLLDMVISSQGYTWSGTLKSNPVYEREIIPYTGDEPNVTLDDSAQRKFKAGWNSDQVGYLNYHGAVVNAGFIRDAARPDWNELDVVQFPDDTAGGFGFNDLNNVWQSQIYHAPQDGQYAFNLNLLLRAQLQYFKQGNPYNSLDYKVDFGVYAEIYTGTNFIYSYVVPINPFTWYFPKDGPNTNSTYITQDANTSLIFPASTVLGSNANGNYILLDQGWTVRFYLGYNSTGLRKATGSNPPYYSGNLDANKEFRIESFGFKFRAGSFVECNDSLSAYGEGFQIPYQAFINQKMKQKDLFQDLIARYNAHIYINPDKERDIVIDTGATFLDPGTADTEDWSDLKENDEHDVIQHVSELQNERLLLTYKESSDAFSEAYKGSTSEIYGQHEHTFANSFVKGVRKVETPFTETPIIEIDRMYYPAVEQGNKDGALRVWYAPKGGIQMKEFSSLRYFVLLAADGQHTLGTAGSFYPYAGHLQNPNRVNDTQVYDSVNDNDINFGTLAYYFPQTLIGVNSLPPYTLKELYWNRRIDQMNKGKMLSTLLNLTSRHVKLLRKKPYTRIWINNAYWQVNKIDYEGNDELRKLTPVELVSLNNLKHEKGRVIRPVRPTSGGILTPHDGVSDTNAVGSGVVNWEVLGTYNVIGNDVTDVYISGNDNEVAPNVKGVNIQNSNNVTVIGSNVSVIDTDDITVTSDNVTIIKGVLYVGEKQAALYNLVDGGEDEVRAIGAYSKFNLIESGKNINLNNFAESPIALIDSKEGENKIISTDDFNRN